jgi:hypothetical protein
MTTREYPSSAGGPPHVVTEDRGRLSCTCQGFKYRRTCRHVQDAFPSENSTFLSAALAYEAMGYHVIPVAPRQKIPMVRWKDYQEVRPPAAKLRAWWSRTPNANVGLVLGQCRIAVDLDGGEDAEALLTEAGVALPADAPRSRTRSGYHVFLSVPTPQADKIGLLRAQTCRVDEDCITPGGRVRRPQVDVRGLGIIIAPPSVHPSGAVYEWISPLVETPPMAPDRLIELLTPLDFFV